MNGVRGATVTLRHAGGETVTDTVTLAGAGFSITAGGGSFSLSHSEERRVTVTFAPTSSGPHTGSLVAGGAVLPLSGTSVGTGQVTFVPSAHDFGPDPSREFQFMLPNNTVLISSPHACFALNLFTRSSVF